jgi:molecular chaperone GrpE
MTGDPSKAAGVDPAAPGTMPDSASDGAMEGAGPQPEAELPSAPPAAPEGHDAASPAQAAPPQPEPELAPAPAAAVSGSPAGEPDLGTLAARAQKAEEYLAIAQRTQADFENFRKRAARDARSAQERGAIKLAQALLPAIDDLDRALAHADATLQAGGRVDNGDGDGANGTDSLLHGLKHVHAAVISALGGVGIERYSPEGERFDPVYHEAVAQQPVEGTEPGIVVEVYQRGYRIGENVVRPARVVVAG